MIKEALNYLVSLGRTPPAAVTIDGVTYKLDSNGRVIDTIASFTQTNDRNDELAILRHQYEMEATRRELENEAHYKKPGLIKTSTLTSITSYLMANPEGFFDNFNKPLIHIASAEEVRLMTAMDYKGNRTAVMTATAITPGIPFDRFMPIEQFIIMLQTQFAPDGDWEKVLHVVSNMTDQESFHLKDDGVRQTVTIKKGAVDIGEANVPNPVMLAPFRTFNEAVQPRGHYTLRIDGKGRAALFGVGGNEWQITAMQNIRNYLVETIEGVEVDILM